jgi:hypothetical protein
MTRSVRLPLLLALSLGAAACGRPEPERAATTADTTAAPRPPDTAWARVPEDRAAAYPAARAVRLAPFVLLPCAGATGDSITDVLSTAGGSLRLPRAGHMITLAEGALGDPTAFTLREVPGTGHLTFEAGPDVTLGLPAVLKLNLARCGSPTDSLVVLRVSAGAPAEDVGGQRTDSILSVPVASLGRFVVARK